MSVDIYPATQTGKLIEHADNWDDESTMNLANGNFYGLIHVLGIDHLVPELPSAIPVKALELAIVTSPENYYTERLRKLCAIARIKKAPLIAFA